MRTCPACGEDTKAGYSEACTNCGFSPGDPSQTAGSFGVGDSPFDTSTFDAPAPAEAPPAPEPAETAPDPAETSPAPVPEPSREPQRKRRPGIGVIIWVAIIAGSFLSQGLGLFEEPTGPNPVDVEGALILEATERGISITASCPADAAETEVGGRFECTVATRSGRTATVEVINREDSYEYSVDDLLALRRGPG